MVRRMESVTDGMMVIRGGWKRSNILLAFVFYGVVLLCATTFGMLATNFVENKQWLPGSLYLLTLFATLLFVWTVVKKVHMERQHDPQLAKTQRRSRTR